MIDGAVAGAEEVVLDREGGETARVGGNGPKQFRHQPIEGRERIVVRLVRTVRHRRLEGRPYLRITVDCSQPGYDIVECVSPLTERQKIVEALENHILSPEVF